MKKDRRQRNDNMMTKEGVLLLGWTVDLEDEIEGNEKN
jgi:hypothetical protein